MGDGLGGVGFDGVRDSDEDGRAAVDGDEHDALALRPMLVRDRLKPGDVRSEFPEQDTVSKRDLSAVHRPGNALARVALKILGGGQIKAALLSTFDNRRRER